MEKDPAFLEEIKAEFLAESGAIDQRVSMQNTLVAIPKEGRADILSIWKCHRSFLGCVAFFFRFR